MPLTLPDIRRIAAEVAKEQNPPLDVVAATPSEGESTYVEVLLTVRGCRNEPCRVIVGVHPNASEADFRVAMAARLAEHQTEPH